MTYNNILGRARKEKTSIMTRNEKLYVNEPLIRSHSTIICDSTGQTNTLNSVIVPSAYNLASNLCSGAASPKE